VAAGRSSVPVRLKPDTTHFLLHDSPDSPDSSDSRDSP